MKMTAPPFTGLGEVHRRYLEERGLTGETIKGAGFYSARPGDLSRLAGRSVPDETSGLVIPYPNAPDFCRLRLFPPIPTADGKPQKFGQPLGTGVRAYIPADVAEILTDPTHSLAITEGEVKALALTQVGWACIGLGGVWNFRCKDLPRNQMIEDLEAIRWDRRIVRLVPDSDAWTNEQVLLAVFTLARLLENREATVLIVRLPALQGQEKVGADDYLVSKGSDAFRRVVEKKATTLGDSAFRPFREREKQQARTTPATKVPERLAGRRIHPALHMEEDLATLGIVEQGPDGLVCKIVTSDREEYPVETLAPILKTKAYPYKGIVDRWDAEDRDSWLKGESDPASFAVATGTVLALFNKLLDVPQTTATILAVWTVATYFHCLFPAFARLFLTGEKGSGKSKAQSIVAGLAWNGLYRIVPTGAVLYRMIEALRPTYCVSEADHLESEQRQVLEAVVNEGYVRGGMVDRCDAETQEPRTFEVYAPLALGNIKGLKGVTEDRAISLVMTRGTNRAKLNADVYTDDRTFRAVRDLLHRLALERFRDMAERYRTLPDPSWLVARERQLWRPLMAVAHLADTEADSGLNLTGTIQAAAKRQTEDRRHPSEEVEALVAILDERLVGNEIMRLHPGDLVDDLKAKLRREYLTATWVGHLLRRNGFVKPNPPGDRDAEGVIYLITRTQVAAILARYEEPPEQPTNLHTPETYIEQPIENKDFQATNVGM